MTLAFDDVRVFDGTRVIEHAVVLVAGDVISAVGADVSIPARVPVVDGRGKTLLPGLIDAHTHTHDLAHLEQALAYGVTTELDMYGDPAQSRQLASAVADEAPGAHADLRAAGYGATAPGGHGTEYGTPVPTLAKAADAAAFVAARVDEGSDYIKIIYDDGAAYGFDMPTLDQATVVAVVEAAHARDRLAVAHIGDLATARGAIEAGVDGLVHLFIGPAPDPEFGALAARHRVFVVPTLSVLHTMCEPGHGAALAADPRIAPGLSPDVRANLGESFASAGRFTCDHANAAMAQLSAAGVPILAGTDAPNPGTAHGASMHEELALLVGAGLSPTEALTAATSAPARAFGLSDRGAIAPGKRADLLLVDGDPTTDITATRAVAGVWARGARFDRDAYLAARANEQAKARDTVARGAISDFEDGTLATKFGAGFALSTDAIARGTSTGDLTVVDGGANGSARALRISGTIAGPLPYAWAGAAFSPGAKTFAPADLSGSKALRFWARGDGKTYRLLFFTSESGPTPLGTTFVAGPAWSEHVIDLAEIPRLTTGAVRMILFCGGPTPGAFELFVDDVSLVDR